MYDEAFERFLNTRKKSHETIYHLARRLKLLFEWLEKKPNDFVKICKEDPYKATDIITGWIVQRIDTSPADAEQHLAAIKSFLRMNQAEKDIRFDLISEQIPKHSRHSKDIAIPKDVILTLYSSADPRDKAMMQLLAHGLREGAFDFPVQKDQHIRGFYDYLRMKHLSVVVNKEGGYVEVPFMQSMEQGINDKIVCGRLTVYSGEDEEYKPLLTPEAIHVIADYCRLRKEHGEGLKEDSPLIRNIFAISERISKRYRNLRTRNVKEVWSISRSGIMSRINYLYYKFGVRKSTVERYKGRHEFKVMHGWRKFADTIFKTYMRHDYAEYQLGHLTHYFRPELSQHIDEFKKIIPHLSLDKAKSLELELQKKDEKRIEELKAQLIPQVKAQVLAELISQLGANIKIERAIPVESH